MPKPTELPKINLPTFIGGEAIDFKNGVAGSFLSAHNMDFRSKPSQMTVLPGMRTLPTSTQLRDKPTCMDMDVSGARYMVGDQGWVYKVDNSDAISRIDQLATPGAAGIAYNQQNDQVYMSDQQTVSLYGQTQQNPVLRKGHFGRSASVAPGVIYVFNTATSSYDGGVDSNTTLSTTRNNLNSLTLTGVTPGNYAGLVTNSLVGTYVCGKLNADGIPSEAAADFCALVPDIEPFSDLAVFVTTVGSGNMILTMHDSLNNKLAQVTVLHAQVVPGWNLISFPSPGIRAFINAIASSNGATGYHWHINSSAASDTMAIATVANQTLSGANFVLFCHRLVQTNNGWHPMAIFNASLLVCNANYLSVYNFGNDANPNNNQWVRHRLLFDVGCEGTSIAFAGQYALVTAGHTSNNAARSFQGGYVYIWDGVSQNWITRIPMPQGIPYAAQNFNNNIYVLCAGSLYVWGGGSTMLHVRYVGYQNTDYLGTYDHTVVNPNMLDIRNNLLLCGYPSLTTNFNIDMGIYSWGAVELSYPNSFGFSYNLASDMRTSSGGTGGNGWTGLQIGMIKNFVDTLYTSWQYTDTFAVTHYGVDVTDNSSSPNPTFDFATLIWDGGAVWKPKKGVRLLVSMLPLPEGTTVTGWYNLDRQGQVDADIATQTAYTAGENMTSILVNVPNSRAREIQVGFTGTCADGSVTPTVIGVTFEIDELEGEPDLREYEPVNNG